MGRKITHFDLCDVTGYDRVRMQTIIKNVPPYCHQKGVARVAKEYYRLDLIVLSVVRALDEELGLRLQAIAAIGLQLREELAVPRGLNENAGLLIRISPPSVRYVDLKGEPGIGIVVPLKQIFDKIDRYGSFAPLEGETGHLNLPPSIIRSQQRKAGK